MTPASSGNSNVQLKAVSLTGGLDLTTPRMLVEPGKLVDCQNYECVDTDGYKKIDGFERYDGGPTPSVTGYWSITTTVSNGLGSDISAGDTVQIVYTDSTATDRSATAICRSIFNSGGKWAIEFFPAPPQGISTATSAILISVTGGGSMNAGTSGGIIITSETDAIASVLASADTVRATIDGLPQEQFMYAMHMYKNKLHVVADCRYIYLAYDTTTSPVPVDPYFYVGNYIRNHTGTGRFQARIMDWKWIRGEFNSLGTTSSNNAWAKVLVYATSPNGTFTNGSVGYIDRKDDDFSTTIAMWKSYNSLSGVTGAPTDSTAVWGGSLWYGLDDGAVRTDNNDWTQVDMGYEVFFNGGSSTIEPRELSLTTTADELAANTVTLDGSPANDDTTGYVNLAGGYINDAATFPGGTGDAVALDSGSYSLSVDNTTGVYAQQILGIWGDGTGIKFSNFGLAVPEDSIITGVTLSAKCFWKSAGSPGTPFFADVKLTKAGSVNKGGSGASIASTSAAAPTSFTFGGANDKWGLTEILPADVNESTFGVWMSPNATSLTDTQYLFWDTVILTVHYFRPVGKLYFYDGTSEIEAKLVRIHLEKGSWAAGDAEGVAHIYDIVPNGTRNYIKVGDDIRLTSGGTKIADVTSYKASFLPSRADLVASDRRFEIVRANYFLNIDYETIYGVHGLGRAWSYDSRYFRKIYTNYESVLDKPSHIISYRNYLLLGYNSGNVLMSAIDGNKGPLPEEFRATKGAREFNFVDPVHGFSVLVDTSLGVLCESSINRISVNQSAVSADGLFVTSVINPNSGCVEYTADSFGDFTLYCDQYGIRTIEQTDKYGDLMARPLSFPVSPWIKSRLSSKKYWNDSRPAQRAIFAHTIKAKNQYRVWFDDGYVLCMNLNSAESVPQFTFLRYGFNFGGSFIPLTPICMSHTTDETVTERIHIGHWNRNGSTTSAENSATLFKYAFELEKGWSFDGQDFPAYMTVNLSFLESPFDYDNIRKVDLHGLDYNNTTLFAAAGTKYSEEKTYSGMDFSSTYVPAGRNVADTVGTDYTPFNKVIQTAMRGRPIYLKLKNTTTATGGFDSCVIEPPHILQALLVYHTPLRQEV